MSEQAGRYQRSFAGLVGALIAALLVIAFVWGLTHFQHRDIPNPAPTVDYHAALAIARQQAPFPVLAPTPEPPGWRATSVSWDGSGRSNAWHVGFLTSASESAQYVGLDQGNADPSAFVADVTTADEPGDPVMIDGVEWTTLHSADGRETAVVRTVPGETTVVAGTASLDTLLGFASSLTAN